MKYRLAVILVNGDFRIHGEDCIDITRDARQSDAGAWYVEAETRHEANIACWGDIATNDHAEGSPEWHAYVDTCADMASRYLPCVPSGLKEN